MNKRKIPMWKFYELIGMSAAAFSKYNKIIRVANGMTKTKHQPQFISDL